jgi:predicted nucleic acid-binding protein
MIKLFVDTNIVIDLLSKRKPFYIEAQELFSIAAESKSITLYISALTVANTHYILSKFHHTFMVREILSKLQPLVSILSLDDEIINKAISSNFKDFEDAI